MRILIPLDAVNKSFASSDGGPEEAEGGISDSSVLVAAMVGAFWEENGGTPDGACCWPGRDALFPVLVATVGCVAS